MKMSRKMNIALFLIFTSMAFLITVILKQVLLGIGLFLLGYMVSRRNTTN